MITVDSTDGVRLAVHELGPSDPDAAPLLLCHATGFHGRVWRALADELPDRRCLALDFRGYGDSTEQDGELTWEGSPPLLPLPSTTIHAQTLCRGRLRLTGLRVPYSPNGMTSVSYSACATTQSGLSSTLLLEGRCGTDQNSLPLLPWEL